MCITKSPNYCLMLRNHPLLFLPSLVPSHLDMLCEPTDLNWWEGVPFEAITGRTAIIDSLLAEVFRGSAQL